MRHRIKVGFFVPREDQTINDLIGKVYREVFEKCKQNPNIELIKISPDDGYNEEVFCGIVCGDAALEQIDKKYLAARNNSTSNYPIPLLALTGMARQGVIALMPSPSKSGFLLARMVIALLTRKLANINFVIPKEYARNSQIVLVSMEDADDFWGERYASFRSVLNVTWRNVTVAHVKIKHGNWSSLCDELQKIHPYIVAIHGYGEDFSKGVNKAARELTNTLFCCDYNYEISSQSPENIHCLGLKHFHGNDVFARLACVAVDIFSTALAVEAPLRADEDYDAKRSFQYFQEWIDHTRYFQSEIGSINFSENKSSLYYPFYCTSANGNIPVDFFFDEYGESSENSVGVLHDVDECVKNWDGDSPHQLLDDITKNIIKKHFPVAWVNYIYKFVDDYSKNRLLPDQIRCKELHDINFSAVACCVGSNIDNGICQINFCLDDYENNAVNRFYVKTDSGLMTLLSFAKAHGEAPQCKYKIYVGKDIETAIESNHEDAPRLLSVYQEHRLLWSCK